MNWHNLKITRKNADGTMRVETDFEMSIRDAADTGVFNNLGVMDIHKVEFSGPAAGPHFADVTQAYLSHYHEMTHETPMDVKRR
jgi:hypothetical protein